MCVCVCELLINGRKCLVSIVTIRAGGYMKSLQRKGIPNFAKRTIVRWFIAEGFFPGQAVQEAGDGGTVQYGV